HLTSNRKWKLENRKSQRSCAEDFLVGGDAGLDLDEAVGSEGSDVTFLAHIAEFLHGGAGGDGVEHFGVGHEEFVDADAAGEAGIAAFFAALGAVEVIQ